MIILDTVNTVPELTNVDMANAIIGFLSATFVLPVIQQPSWPAKVRALVTFVWCLLAGFVVMWVAGDLSAGKLTHSILVTFVTAIATYYGFAQPTKIAPAIENATSPGSARKIPLDDPPG